MNNIICPVDFSEASIQAIEFAAKTAAKHDSSITLLHVYTEEEYDADLPDLDNLEYDSIIETVTRKLDSLAGEINKMHMKDYPMCSYKVVTGDLVDKILDTIEDDNASMVVMGTYGAADVREADLGTNTEKIMERTRVPVLSIPSNASFSGLDRIVYASDFDEDDLKILSKIVNFALPFNSRIYVVHISHSTKDDQEYEDYTSEMKSYLAYEKMSFEQVQTKESVEISLEHVLNLHDADLLVMYRKDRHFLESLFHRSLTKKMAYLSNFPLMVLKL